MNKISQIMITDINQLDFDKKYTYAARNSQKEMKQKFELYENAGVKEYWLGYPANETVFAYFLDEKGIYIGRRPYIGWMQLTSKAIDGFELNIAEVFQ